MKISREWRDGSRRLLSGSTLFSSSLPLFPHPKFPPNGFGTCNQPIDDQAQEIINLLPDDEEELLSGIMDDLALTGLSGPADDLEDYDVFGTGGGMELETGPRDNLRKSQLDFPNGFDIVLGEHPLIEHPSRTLFVRNITSNVEDSELNYLFEQYGEIRALFTACKHRGFVMISYYDIRAARAAMRGLQDKPLRRRKLDIHFSIPKDHPPGKEINQGTLVVFNLEPTFTDEELFQIFGVYGEVKEVRETPSKNHHRFVEFFDVRAAEVALKALNGREIAGKRIKLEPGRPGGSHRNLMSQLNQDIKQDDSPGFMHHVGSPLTSSSAGRTICHIGSSLTSSSAGNWQNNPVEHSLLQGLRSSMFRTLTPTAGSYMPAISPVMRSQGPISDQVATFGQDQGRNGHFEHLLSMNHNSGLGTAFPEPHSVPELSFGHFHHGTEMLSRSQFLWGNPNSYSETSNSSVWPASFTVNPFSSSENGYGSAFSGQQRQQYYNHHTGSEPSRFSPVSTEPSSVISPGSFGGTHNSMSSRIPIPRNMPESGLRMMSTSTQSPVALSIGSYPRLATPIITEGILGRNRRMETNSNQVDNKKQYQLFLDKIISGEDTRTTLMIKNIPNKYTSKMLLAAIDEKNLGTYDFLYLPIDFKNKCNVGYAFINMLLPKHILPFYEAFNGKKWEKFNSEKVASLAYARIQGKSSLISHFKNSSLMYEDNSYRPILFTCYKEHSEKTCLKYIRRDATGQPERTGQRMKSS